MQVDPGVDAFLNDTESESRVVVLGEFLVQRGVAVPVDMSEGADELLGLVLLGDLQLSVSHAIAKHQDVLWPTVVHVPVFDQAVREGSL